MARSPKETQPEAPPVRRGRPGVLASDARNLTNTAFARAGFTDPTLVLRWPTIAGPDVARLAQPLKLAGEILTLKALPGAALFLAHEKRSLCERINAYLGRPAVSQIKFVQGVFAPPPPAPRPARPAGPLPSTDPSRRFAGPEGLAHALQALACRRGQD